MIRAYGQLWGKRTQNKIVQLVSLTELTLDLKSFHFWVDYIMQNFDMTLNTTREQKESGGIEPEIVDRRNTLSLD